MILDTCFIIDLMRGDEKAKLKLDEIFQLNEEHYISALTVFELFSGVAQSSQSITEKQKVRNTLKSQNVISLDYKNSELAGTIFGTQILSGNKLTVVDTMIAATAQLKGQAVLTRNIKDFQKIPNTQVEGY